MWLRTTRLPLLIALLIALGVVAFLGTHPRLVAPFASRLVSRNLLGDLGGKFRVRDFRWRSINGLDLFQVSFTFKGEAGAVTLISADTLSVEYRPRELFGPRPRLRWLALAGVEVYALQGEGKAAGNPPVGGWPRLQIDQLEILEGSLEVSGPDGRLQERIPSFRWRGALAADSLLSLDCRDADIHWQTHDSHLWGLHGRLELGPEGARAVDLNCRLNESRVVLDGRRNWDGRLDLAVRGERLVAHQVENLLDMTLGFTAELDMDAVFTSRGDSLLLVGSFDGELEGYRLDQLAGRAVITPDRVQWEELSGGINSVRFRGRGDFDISDPLAISFTLTGEATDVDLSRGLVPGEELPPTGGHGRLTIFHSDRPLLTTVTGTLREGFIASIPFDSVQVDVRVDAAGASFERIALDYRGQTALLSGRTDTSRTFAGEVSFYAPDLSRLPAGWNLPALGGRLAGQGRLQGPQEGLMFAGRLSLRDLALSPLRADSSEVNLVVRNVLTGPSASLEIQGGGLSLSGVPVGEFDLRGEISGRRARLDAFRSVLGDTVLALAGQAAFGDSTTTIRAEELAVDLEGNHWRMAAPASFVVGAGRFVLPRFRLASEQGELVVQDLSRADSLSGSILLRNFDLGLLNPFLARRVSGKATARVRLGGRPRDPEIQVTADLVACQLAPARIDSVRLEAGFGQGHLVVNRLFLKSDRGRLTCRGSISHPGVGPAEFWAGAELDLALSVRDGDWAFVDHFRVPALDRIAGRFEGNFQVGGTTRQPTITGDLRSAPFNVHWLHLESLTGRVRVESDQLVLSELAGRQGALTVNGQIELPLTFDLVSVPDTPVDGPFLMRLRIPPSSDLEPLARATNAFIECGGRGEAEVTIAGPLDHPFWDGRLAVRDGRFVLRGLGEIYRRVEAAGTFAGDELVLDRLEAREGARGKIRGRGRVVFAGLKLETFAIDLDVDRFLVASIPDLRVLVRSPVVRLSGVKVGPDSLIVPKFSGRLQVIEARYTGDFAEKPGVSDPRVATVAPDWLAEIHLVAPPRTGRIVNRAMELYMSGDVDLIRDLEGLYLRGSMDIDSGRLPVFNNDFKVVRGRLDFSKEVGLVPGVDMEAETTVRVRSATYEGSSALERITVYVTGTLDEPEVRFSSESGYAREGIERMLLGLSPYAGDPREGGGLRDASIAAGLNLLEREIATGLNVIDTFDIDQVERERVDGTGTLSPLIGVGKYLGSDLYIKYAQGLSQADRDLLIEYQITDHLLLQSEIRRRIDELQGDTTYNLDLKYRFEY